MKKKKTFYLLVLAATGSTAALWIWKNFLKKET